MAASTRSGDIHRMEESLKETLRATVNELVMQLNTSNQMHAQSMKELKEDFIALNLQHNELMDKIAGENEGNSHTTWGSQTRSKYFASRQSKVEFPIFNGEDLKGWLFCCQHFFAVDQIPAEAKIKLAVIHLEGRALQWHQNWIKFKGGSEDITWENYVAAVEDRFGDQFFNDPMAELLSLKQSGTVSDYHDQFEAVLGRVNISESYAISFFINGLKSYIQKGVKMFMPKTLTHALALARLQESSSNSMEYYTKRPLGTNSKPLIPNPPSTVKGRRVLSSTEFDEKRAKELCFWCNEKYERSHTCAKK